MMSFSERPASSHFFGDGQISWLGSLQIFKSLVTIAFGTLRSMRLGMDSLSGALHAGLSFHWLSAHFLSSCSLHYHSLLASLVSRSLNAEYFHFYAHDYAFKIITLFSASFP
jgi:hypothetical protein